ncbi:exopolysaccharide biosynthesis polyprenyl glycosylphosphotransferase [Streptomyces sp. 891-h]|uniref:exopolysaccharide biosynthesis polyprenyl glycosylphosphotransferase n=1 Tax=Streptomyces sp. 891-h TaxID=2720714 RepID=UPI001FA99E84|nr:exopolysaccharide biosynthesis polyprenyl glycosylphosphotransferase [Streptomyces sp. 891-h]UNZ16381.1 exopolysaccharide biosynthesis polyprenyl glycosylphosphotransferase [Streptomyces sp. 891-h]
MTTQSADSAPNPRSVAEPDRTAAESTAHIASLLPRPGAGTDHAAQEQAEGAREVTAPSVPSARGPVPGTAPPAAARRRPGPALPLVAADVAGTAVAALACAEPDGAALLLAPVCASLTALCARAGLYRPRLDPQALDELPALSRRVAIAWCVGVTVLAACDRTGTLSLTGLLAGIAASAVLACTGRALVHGLRRRRGRSRPRAALIVGQGEPAYAVTAALAQQRRYGLRPVALVVPDGGAPAGRSPLPVVTALDEVARTVTGSAVRDAVFVRSPWEDPHTAGLAALLGANGVTGWLVRPGCALGAHGGHALAVGERSLQTHLWGFSCHRLALECPRPRTGRRKRLLDIALAAPALLLAAPVMAGCALAVRLLDGPGVLFRQERIGQDGRPFALLKFRTVRHSDEHEAATRWTVAGDARTSHVGRLLRRTSLDELPQLWNVLRGDMSLVGPRPERPYFVGKFSDRYPGYAQRHRAPVGITGLAQVHGLRGDTSIADRARFDNHYIETWSLWQDVRIICRTATSFFRLEGR